LCFIFKYRETCINLKKNYMFSLSSCTKVASNSKIYRAFVSFIKTANYHFLYGVWPLSDVIVRLALSAGQQFPMADCGAQDPVYLISSSLYLS